MHLSENTSVRRTRRSKDHGPGEHRIERREECRIFPLLMACPSVAHAGVHTPTPDPLFRVSVLLGPIPQGVGDELVAHEIVGVNTYIPPLHVRPRYNLFACSFGISKHRLNNIMNTKCFWSRLFLFFILLGSVKYPSRLWLLTVMEIFLLAHCTSDVTVSYQISVHPSFRSIALPPFPHTALLCSNSLVRPFRPPTQAWVPH